MALFKKDSAPAKLLSTSVSYTEYGEAVNSKLFPLILNEAQGLTSTNNINYMNGDPFESKSTEQPSSSGSSNDGGWAIDIAQSHHFTVEIRDASNHRSQSGNLLSYKTPNNVYSNFLPVKSMSLSYPSYENMNISLSIFGDFPLLMRRRVETITLVCYDEDTSPLEKNLQVWNEECFPQGKYVAYMDNIVKELIYRGYTVDGRESMHVRRFVIPAGQVMVNRDYSENEAKMITFSLACVGDGNTCATGSPSAITNIPISPTSGGTDVNVTNNVTNTVNSLNKNTSNAIFNNNSNFIGNEAPLSNPPGVPKTVSAQKATQAKKVAKQTMTASKLITNPFALPAMVVGSFFGNKK